LAGAALNINGWALPDFPRYTAKDGIEHSAG
jgi:hypothetical protein